MDISFDIVIPLGPNDISFINKMTDHIKQNIIGYRNIYIVTYDPKIEVENCITIDENIFPFNKHLLENFNTNPDKTGWAERTGWYLQQLIKLYSGFVIPNILNNYLIIDADVFFLKPTTFFENGYPLYATSEEHHIPYFEHMSRLHPVLSKQANVSGICHHMIFQADLVRSLFDLVENHHKQEFWKCFMFCIDFNSNTCGSGASEYEIYFNYLLIYHKDKIQTRHLKWINTAELKDYPDYDFISYPWFWR